jgi:signal transduction histidine kinase
MAAKTSFTKRLTLALAILLLSYGAFVAYLSRQVAQEHGQEAMQRMSHGLAQHIVEHWPQISMSDRSKADRAERDTMLSMLMVVNPGIQVYILDSNGQVKHFIGDQHKVLQRQVDLKPIQAFLAGARLPILGSDPIGAGKPRIFSVAMLPSRSIDLQKPDYLYIMLEGETRDEVLNQLSFKRIWQSVGLVALIGLLLTFLAGAIAFRNITLPLQKLANRMHKYSVFGDQTAVENVHDEVHAISDAFNSMTNRIETQATKVEEQSSAHREMMASVAHDLRTPLTALHGHLEALSSKQSFQAEHREKILNTALAQSEKVRRLSQQLFEMATLQATDEVLHRERFRLDELVNDSVQKFGLNNGQENGPPLVVLAGDAPGNLEIDGDLQLIERAISNLIDNAMRHAPNSAPVRVSVMKQANFASILIEDEGPGLPQELVDRLAIGQSLRDPPIKRISGGIGGLGLAIAQRIAILHGGSLKTIQRPHAKNSGTSLCLSLPLAT